MKYYVVKLIAKATDDNLMFKGQTHVYYYGKDQNMIGSECSGDWIDTGGIVKWKLKEYGYKRLCDAKRSWVYNNPTCKSAIRPWYEWNETTEIIEVEGD